MCSELSILEETAQHDMVPAIHRIISLLRMTSAHEKMRKKLNAVVCGPDPLCVRQAVVHSGKTLFYGMHLPQTIFEGLRKHCSFQCGIAAKLSSIFVI